MDNIFSCIPCCRASSSSPTADISHFKAEIDGNFSEETVDELISHMNHFLKKLKGEQDSMSVAASSARVTAAVSTAGKIHEELAQCIEYNMGKVKRNARKAKRKVMDALDNGTTKLIGEILKESKAFPYVGVAAAVVVFLLDKLYQMGKVDNERLEFLERMWSMAKIINNVRNPEQRDHCRAMFVFVLQMSICIYNKIQAATPFARFLSSHIDAADLVEMEKKFADQHQNLMTDFIVSIRNDIPQVKPPPPMLDMPATYGIKDAIEEVKTRLDMEGKSKKIIVTIFGFGGIGKTTLAEAVTNSLSDYKFCRLYLNSDLKSSKIEDLQAQLLRDVFSINRKVSNPSEGRTVIRGTVKENQGKKPLYLFIDNALEGSEIERLLPLGEISQLSLEVRILVTTRDSRKIPLMQHFEDKKYQVGENPSAKEMLCHYAGENPSNFANMKEVDEVLDMCGGIPLFIQLVGKKLLNQVDKAKICRQMKFAALGVDNNTILDFVYKQLPPDFQQAFLDIAFFYLGYQRYKLERIYTQDVIKGLEDAALITTITIKISCLYYSKAAERVMMHDRLWERAHELCKGERVSDRSEWEEAIESVKLYPAMVETLLTGEWGGGCMRLEEGGEMVWEDAQFSDVLSNGAKVAYLDTGWHRHLSDECKAGLQEAVDEGYEVVLVDNGVHRWNRHVVMEGMKLFGEVPWDEEDKEMMKEMMCQVPGGCTTVWTSAFPKTCLLLSTLLHAQSDPTYQVIMTGGKWEEDDNQSSTFHSEESKSWSHYHNSFREGRETLGGYHFRDSRLPTQTFFNDITNLNYWQIKDSKSG